VQVQVLSRAFLNFMAKKILRFLLGVFILLFPATATMTPGLMEFFQNLRENK